MLQKYWMKQQQKKSEKLSNLKITTIYISEHSTFLDSK